MSQGDAGGIEGRVELLEIGVDGLADGFEVGGEFVERGFVAV